MSKWYVNFVQQFKFIFLKKIVGRKTAIISHDPGEFEATKNK